ncbi:tRNA U34 2-thiouridine synthase MnmA/TrmU [Desulfobotulus alkaliphilus]|uniref:tRNA U34 2-thiouridine synthase MnmA/TrmU n=1 Tax=Desulfobotulus alkaliphilus TaxID=622671 RepID=A0A562RXX5_9BACT|nr:tRNA 4-thiouridine(8) synthase ThiI [Desulfobotulus alkaliphilus]TWI73280.1 tRNA U34 2-thiouridine synthase MnmA/TrmU [Desulfobotulus alkaliphilus]
MKKVRALGLSSGGLDSILAALILRQQGIDVSWVAFETPFFDAAHAVKAAKSHGIPLYVRDITERYLPMLKDPDGGYGKAMNPCKDCHSLMFREAGGMMAEEGFDFLFSGEVSGQRPMSQTPSALRYVEKKSGYEGVILRPLSALNLPETTVEKEGLVDRKGLLGFQGRGRKPQLALAKELGVKDFPAPAGGCLLTDQVFGRRLKDLLDHKADADGLDCHLLKGGRHFRLSPEIRLVVGRTAADNEFLQGFFDPDRHCRIRTVNFPGPLAFLCGPADRGMRLLAAGIVAGYTRALDAVPVTLHMDGRGEKENLDVLPLRSTEVRGLMI